MNALRYWTGFAGLFALGLPLHLGGSWIFLQLLLIPLWFLLYAGRLRAVGASARWLLYPGVVTVGWFLWALVQWPQVAAYLGGYVLQLFEPDSIDAEGGMGALVLGSALGSLLSAPFVLWLGVKARPRRT